MIREERNEGVTIVSKWSEILEKYQWLSFQILMGLGIGDCSLCICFVSKIQEKSGHLDKQLVFKINFTIIQTCAYLCLYSPVYNIMNNRGPAAISKWYLEMLYQRVS